MSEPIPLSPEEEAEIVAWRPWQQFDGAFIGHDIDAALHWGGEMATWMPRLLATLDREREAAARALPGVEQLAAAVKALPSPDPSFPSGYYTPDMVSRKAVLAALAALPPESRAERLRRIERLARDVDNLAPVDSALGAGNWSPDAIEALIDLRAALAPSQEHAPAAPPTNDDAAPKDGAQSVATHGGPVPEAYTAGPAPVAPPTLDVERLHGAVARVWPWTGDVPLDQWVDAVAAEYARTGGSDAS